MSKGYIRNRLLRSVISILIIMLIVFTLVYSLVPRNSIFSGDDGYRKLAAKPDDKTDYVYNIWQKRCSPDRKRPSSSRPSTRRMAIRSKRTPKAAATTPIRTFRSSSMLRFGLRT